MGTTQRTTGASTGDPAFAREYRCPLDRQPCEVVALLGPWLEKTLEPSASPELPQLLPCDRCRAIEQAANGLLRLRLGKHERNILLYAPPPEADQGAILDPELRTHSERETYLRAVRKLQRAGLATTSRRFMRLETSGKRGDGSSVARTYLHRTLWASPLGMAVREQYRQELENGQPIRWARRLPLVMSAARLPAHDLVLLMIRRLEAAPTEQSAAQPDARARLAKGLLHAARRLMETLAPRA